MIYLTLSDDYSGVYHSQVLDVCRYFRQWLGIPIRLIAIVPLRTYKNTRRRIIGIIPDALVFPMWPSRLKWQRNTWLISFLKKFLKDEVVICRGVLATNLAMNFKKKGYIKKIIYDARGASAAEWAEYLHQENEKLSREIKHLERNALLYADFHMSISDTLVEYWRSHFSYEEKNYVTIPTTLSESFLEPLLDERNRQEVRLEYGFKPGEIVIAYSGSSAGWQSFSLLKRTVFGFMENDVRIRFLLMNDDPGPLFSLITDFPGRVSIRKCSHKEVFNLLNMVDYGLLIREDSITNRVSAPTKFAEYLAAGCGVLLKGTVGDYNQFLKDNNCGILLSDSTIPSLHPLKSEERENNNAIAHKFFCKYSDYIEKKYRYLLSQIMN